jgi:hypothetical protein
MVAAADLVEVSAIIDDFVATVEDKYFQRYDGVMSLK